MSEEIKEEMKTARQWSLITLIPYSTLRAAIRSGQLPALRFTPKGQIYVLREDIDAFIEQAKTRALTEEDPDPMVMDIPSAD